jgi:glycosyltransferase involved in cell wall biosynthesis
MIFIITTETFPYGLAATQRIKCYAKSVVALGHNCKIICVNRCENPDKPLGNINPKGAVDGYEYQYIGGSTLIKKGWRNSFNQFADTCRLAMMMLLSFSQKDKAILYSYNSLLLSLVKTVAIIKKFKVYFELNEHPSVLHSLFGIKGEFAEERNIVKRKLKGFDGILCISSLLKDYLVSCDISEEKVHVVNMLVDESRFADIKREDKEPYIGYCGAADNNKDGVDQLIKAFSIVHNKYHALKLFIMGPKTPNSNNEELARVLGFKESVVFTGMISSEQMPQMLKNASVLALNRPQSIQAKYGFPTKLGEYLLTGNPVVVTGVGDIPRFLKDGESAYIANPDDVNSFAQKLDYVLSHPAESKQVGECGRGIALKSFSGNQIMSQLKEALNL